MWSSVLNETLIELRSNIIRIYYVYFLFNNIHEKILDCDWLREMQFLGNTVQKKGNLVQEKGNKRDILIG